jgi:hypothetical protein
LIKTSAATLVATKNPQSRATPAFDIPIPIGKQIPEEYKRLPHECRL